MTYGNQVIIYRTEQDALARVVKLREIGIWPGMIEAQGGWRLTYDPPLTRIEMNAHGYLVRPS